MPPNKSKPPIGQMTWGRALPVLVICALFDVIRFMFAWFVFFGPALAAFFCAIKLDGGALVTSACVAGAGVVGFFGAGVIESFGLLMAMVVGLAGWAIVTLFLAVTNPRIWKSSVWGWIWSVSALGVSEIPFLGAIPMLTLTHWRLYVGQIRHDKAAIKKYEQEQAQARVTAAARSAREQKLAMMRARDEADRQAEESYSIEERLAMGDPQNAPQTLGNPA